MLSILISSLYQESFPVLAVGGSSGHGSEEVFVDLDDLLHFAGTDVHATCKQNHILAHTSN